MKTRIICFGNEIMNDDAAGLHVARRLRELLDRGELEADVIESAVAGYDLIEMMRDWDRVVLVEAVKLADTQVGEVLRLDPKTEAAPLRLCALRDAGVNTMLTAGEKLGYRMPTDVVLVGIQVEDLCTFGTTLGPAVAAAIPRAVERVVVEVRRKT